VVWVGPPAAATGGMVTLGFFLGPLFPTVISVMPRLVPANLVATAIGVLVGMSILGGAVFPWLVGASAQRLGLWTLLPIIMALAALLGLLWWSIARRLAETAPSTSPSTPAPVVPEGTTGEGGRTGRNQAA